MDKPIIDKVTYPKGYYHKYADNIDDLITIALFIHEKLPDDDENKELFFKAIQEAEYALNSITLLVADEIFQKKEEKHVN